jgi:tetratricopeptide (TPR) repeat protein
MDDRKAMKRREMGSLLRLGVGALLMWLAGQAFASFPATDAERAVLPIYCKDTMGFAGYGDSSYNTSPRAKTWVAKMGETFWAMHHYCVGLVKRNRALRAGVSPTERKFLMESAVGEYAYVLNNLKDPNFVLLPEIYTRVGEAQLVASNPGAADKAFARARAIKPDYWPAYSQWAEYLMQIGKQAEAKQLVKAGLEQAPQARMLIEQYRLLGGKPSEIVPVVKKPVADKAAAEQQATTDKDAETDEVPVDSDSPDE